MLVEHSALTPQPIPCSAHLWTRYSSSVIVLLQVRLASSLLLNVKNNTVVSSFFCHRPTTLNVRVKIRSNRYKSFFSRLLFATAGGKMTILWAWRRRVKDWNDSKSMCGSTHCTKWPFCFWQAHVSWGREVPREKERERERGGGGGGETGSGHGHGHTQVEHTLIPWTISTAQHQPFHADTLCLVSSAGYLRSKIVFILFSVLENIWQRRRWNLLLICYSLFQLVRVGLNFFDKLNFSFEWNWQSRLWVSDFGRRLTKIWGWLPLSDSSNQKGERRGIQAPAQAVAKNTRCAWESM